MHASVDCTNLPLVFVLVFLHFVLVLASFLYQSIRDQCGFYYIYLLFLSRVAFDEVINGVGVSVADGTSCCLSNQK